jgi:hypothetical protein
MKNKYCPDKWIVVKLVAQELVVYKVLAGWTGNFTTASSWRLSSDVLQIVEYPTSYEVFCRTGSVYTCYKHNHGKNLVTLNKLRDWQNYLNTEKEPSTISEVNINSLQDLVH